MIKRQLLPYANKGFVGASELLAFKGDQQNYIDLGNPDKLNFNQDHSWAFSYIYYDTSEGIDQQSTNTHLFKMTGTVGNRVGISMGMFYGLTPPKGIFSLRHKSTKTGMHFEGSKDVLLKKVIHVFCCYHHSDNTARVYMNGELKHEINIGNIDFGNNANWFIGYNNGSSGEIFANSLFGAIKFFNFGSAVPDEIDAQVKQLHRNPYLVPADMRPFCVGEYDLKRSVLYLDEENHYRHGDNAILAFDTSSQYNSERTSNFTEPAHGRLQNFTEADIFGGEAVKDFYAPPARYSNHSYFHLYNIVGFNNGFPPAGVLDNNDGRFTLGKKGYEFECVILFDGFGPSSIRPIYQQAVSGKGGSITFEIINTSDDGEGHKIPGHERFAASIRDQDLNVFFIESHQLLKTNQWYLLKVDFERANENEIVESDFTFWIKELDHLKLSQHGFTEEVLSVDETHKESTRHIILDEGSGVYGEANTAQGNHVYPTILSRIWMKAADSGVISNIEPAKKILGRIYHMGLKIDSIKVLDLYFDKNELPKYCAAGTKIDWYAPQSNTKFSTDLSSYHEVYPGGRAWQYVDNSKTPPSITKGLSFNGTSNYLRIQDFNITSEGKGYTFIIGFKDLGSEVDEFPRFLQKKGNQNVGLALGLGDNKGGYNIFFAHRPDTSNRYIFSTEDLSNHKDNQQFVIFEVFPDPREGYGNIKGNYRLNTDPNRIILESHGDANDWIEFADLTGDTFIGCRDGQDKFFKGAITFFGIIGESSRYTNGVNTSPTGLHLREQLELYGNSFLSYPPLYSQYNWELLLNLQLPVDRDTTPRIRDLSKNNFQVYMEGYSDSELVEDTIYTTFPSLEELFWRYNENILGADSLLHFSQDQGQNINLGSPEKLNFDETHSWAVSFLFRSNVDTAPTDQYNIILSKRERKTSTSQFEKGISFSLTSDGKLYFILRGSSSLILESDFAISKNKTYHVLLWVDAAQNEIGYFINNYKHVKSFNSLTPFGVNSNWEIGDWTGDEISVTNPWDGYLSAFKFFAFGSTIPFDSLRVQVLGLLQRQPYVVPEDLRPYCVGEYDLNEKSYYQDFDNYYRKGVGTLIAYDTSDRYNTYKTTPVEPAHGEFINFENTELGAINPSSATAVKDFDSPKVLNHSSILRLDNRLNLGKRQYLDLNSPQKITSLSTAFTLNIKFIIFSDGIKDGGSGSRGIFQIGVPSGSGENGDFTKAVFDFVFVPSDKTLGCRFLSTHADRPPQGSPDLGRLRSKPISLNTAYHAVIVYDGENLKTSMHLKKIGEDSTEIILPTDAPVPTLQNVIPTPPVVIGRYTDADGGGRHYNDMGLIYFEIYDQPSSEAEAQNLLADNYSDRQPIFRINPTDTQGTTLIDTTPDPATITFHGYSSTEVNPSGGAWLSRSTLLPEPNYFLGLANFQETLSLSKENLPKANEDFTYHFSFFIDETFLATTEDRTYLTLFNIKRGDDITNYIRLTARYDKDEDNRLSIDYGNSSGTGGSFNIIENYVEKKIFHYECFYLKKGNQHKLILNDISHDLAIHEDKNHLEVIIPRDPDATPGGGGTFLSDRVYYRSISLFKRALESKEIAELTLNPFHISNQRQLVIHHNFGCGAIYEQSDQIWLKNYGSSTDSQFINIGYRSLSDIQGLSVPFDKLNSLPERVVDANGLLELTGTNENYIDLGNPAKLDFGSDHSWAISYIHQDTEEGGYSPADQTDQNSNFHFLKMVGNDDDRRGISSGLFYNEPSVYSFGLAAPQKLNGVAHNANRNGKMTHVLCFYDHLTNNAYLFINGSLASQSQIAADVDFKNDSNWYIGYNNATQSSPPKDIYTNTLIGAIKFFDFGSQGISSINSPVKQLNQNPYLVPTELRQYCVGEYNLNGSHYFKDQNNDYGFGSGQIIAFDSSGRYNMDRDSNFTEPAHGILVNFTDQEVGAINPSGTIAIRDFYRIKQHYQPGALYFNGTNQVLDLGTPSKIPSSGDMTISFWIYQITDTPAPGFSQRVIQNQNNPGSTDYDSGFAINVGGNTNAGRYIFGIVDRERDEFQQSIKSERRVIKNTWNHIVFVKSTDDANNWNVYINGQLDPMATKVNAENVTNFSASGNLIIGNTTGFNGGLHAYIKKIDIFSSAYSMDEVADLFNSGILSGSNVLSLNFSETAGTTLIDTSPDPVTVTFNNFDEHQVGAGSGTWIGRQLNLPQVTHYLPIRTESRYIELNNDDAPSSADDFTIHLSLYIGTIHLLENGESAIPLFYGSQNYQLGVFLKNDSNEGSSLSIQVLSSGSKVTEFSISPFYNEADEFHTITIIRRLGQYQCYFNGIRGNNTKTQTIADQHNFASDHFRLGYGLSIDGISPRDETFGLVSFSYLRRSVTSREIQELSKSDTGFENRHQLITHLNFGAGAIYDNNGITKIKNHGSGRNADIINFRGEDTAKLQDLSTPLYVPLPPIEVIGANGLLAFDERDQRIEIHNNPTKLDFNETHSWAVSMVFTTNVEKAAESSFNVLLSKREEKPPGVSTDRGIVFGLKEDGRFRFIVRRPGNTIKDSDITATKDILYHLLIWVDHVNNKIGYHLNGGRFEQNGTLGDFGVLNNWEIGDWSGEQANDVDPWNGHIGAVKFFDFSSLGEIPSNIDTQVEFLRQNPYLVPTELRPYCVGEYDLNNSSYFKDVNNIHGLGSDKIIAFDTSDQYNVNRSSNFTEAAHGELVNFSNGDAIGGNAIKDFYAPDVRLTDDSYFDLYHVFQKHNNVPVPVLHNNDGRFTLGKKSFEFECVLYMNNFGSIGKDVRIYQQNIAIGKAPISIRIINARKLAPFEDGKMALDGQGELFSVAFQDQNKKEFTIASNYTLNPFQWYVLKVKFERANPNQITEADFTFWIKEINHQELYFDGFVEKTLRLEEKHQITDRLVGNREDQDPEYEEAFTGTGTNIYASLFSNVKFNTPDSGVLSSAEMSRATLGRFHHIGLTIDSTKVLDLTFDKHELPSYCAAGTKINWYIKDDGTAFSADTSQHNAILPGSTAWAEGDSMPPPVKKGLNHLNGYYIDLDENPVIPYTTEGFMYIAFWMEELLQDSANGRSFPITLSNNDTATLGEWRLYLILTYENGNKFNLDINYLATSNSIPETNIHIGSYHHSPKSFYSIAISRNHNGEISVYLNGTQVLSNTFLPVWFNTLPSYDGTSFSDTSQLRFGYVYEGIGMPANRVFSQLQLIDFKLGGREVSQRDVAKWHNNSMFRKESKSFRDNKLLVDGKGISINFYTSNKTPVNRVTNQPLSQLFPSEELVIANFNTQEIPSFTDNFPYAIMAERIPENTSGYIEFTVRLTDEGTPLDIRNFDLVAFAYPDDIIADRRDLRFSLINTKVASKSYDGIALRLLNTVMPFEQIQPSGVQDGDILRLERDGAMGSVSIKNITQGINYHSEPANYKGELVVYISAYTRGSIKSYFRMNIGDADNPFIPTVESTNLCYTNQHNPDLNLLR